MRTSTGLAAFVSLCIGVLYAFTTTDMPPTPAGPYAGDDVIPDAVMVYDQTKLINASPGDVWPWVQQVGKGVSGPVAMPSDASPC